MRLRRLDLTRYGRFTDFTLDFGERAEGGPDLHLVYGLNEAGKSTALSGFLDLLFGVEERSRYGFLHPYGAMEVGAVLEFGGARHALRRVKQRSGSLRDASGQPVGEGLLAGALGGLTRDAYRMMFSLDDDTLERGGDAILDSRGDLGELLFSASAGLAGFSKALSAVGSEADELFRKRASTTEIAGLKRRLAELKSERERIDTQAGAHNALVAELDRAGRVYDEASAEHGRLKVRLNELSGLARAAPLLAEQRRLGEELGELADLPRPPDHWATELPALINGDATLKTEVSGLDTQIGRLKEHRDATPVDEALLRLGDRVEALSAASARNTGAEADLPRRRAALAESCSHLAELARSIVGEAGEVDPDALVVGAGTLDALRGLIERWSGIETRVASTAAEVDAAVEALEHAREERALLEHDQPARDAGWKAALRSAVGVAKGSDLVARRRVAAAAADARARTAAEALRLVPWTDGRQDLEEVAAPSPRLIQDWRDTLAGQDARRDELRRGRRDIEMAKTELGARFAVAEAGAGLIGDEEAAELRTRRDRAWTAHRDRPDDGRAAAFEELMRAADAMSDARLAAADRVAEMRSLRRDREVLDARAVREIRLLEEVDEETSNLAERLIEAYPCAGLGTPRTPLGERIAILEAWAARRDKALTTAADHRSALGELQGLEAEMERETARLAGALRNTGSAPEGLDLAALLQAADELLSREASQDQARVAADKLVRDCGRSLDARRKASGSAERADQSWRAEWTGALAGTWFMDRSDDRGAVGSIVEALSGLPARLSARDELARRVTSMEADQETFLAFLDGLKRELGEDAGDAGTWYGRRRLN